MLTYGALFAGYGGLEMGLQSVLGGQAAWVSDIEPGPSAILAAHHPDVPNLGDVTAVDWSTVQPVDVIAGGSPCQDLSTAGARAGMRHGTRSGLWASMCRAIETIRPRLVVWENVQGAHSARATSDLGPCAIGLAHGPDVSLRATGRVLGDLAEIGYDCWWTTIRAADAGAPHARRRVFVFAWPTDPDIHGLAINPRVATAANGQGDDERDRGGHGAHREIPRDDADAAGLAILASTEDAEGDEDEDAWTDPVTGDGLALLPSPVVNDMGDGKTIDWWDEWAPRQKSATGRKAVHGRSLAVEAQRLFPTPTSGFSDASRSAGRTGGDPLISALLPTATASDAGAGSTHKGGNLTLQGAVGGPRADDIARHQRAGRLLPTTTAQDAQRSGGGYGDQTNVTLTDVTARRHGAFGIYTPAIQRWEAMTRPAPPPVDIIKGEPQLSPRFSEWMMGLPDGWVTDPAIGLSRRAQLRAIGNGVVPQQIALAVQLWLYMLTPADRR